MEPVDNEPNSARTCLRCIDAQCSTGDPGATCGRHLDCQCRPNELRRRRKNSIADSFEPNSGRMVARAPEIEMRRLCVTYGCDVGDYLDMGPMLKELGRTTNNNLGQREHETADALKRSDGERLLNKRTVRAFNSTPIDQVLRAHGADARLFFGLSRNTCVEGSVPDVGEAEHASLLNGDARASSTPAAYDAQVQNLRGPGGTMGTTDAVLSALKT